MKEIAVIGAGTMGAGIAQLAAKHGCVTHLIDLDLEAVQRAVDGIKKRFERSVERGRMKADESAATLERIIPSSKIAGLDHVELAIEAVVEDLEVKRKVFAALEEATSDCAVLATNTSSLSITDIANEAANPSRIIGMHFFNPAPVMPLVEVIAGEKSDPSAVDFGVEASLTLGKVPVRAKDTPGFIVNRVARGFYLEALRLLGEGAAGVDEIDHIMRTRAGFKMGPFQLMDLIGVDVNLAVSQSIWERMNKHARFVPHEIQRTLVEQGHLGQKTGRGFYLHDRPVPIPAWPVNRRSIDLSPLLNDAMLAFCTKGDMPEASGTEQLVLSRILGAIMNEAGLTYSEQVAGSDDIDTAMIRGTNYPKGPLAWADEVGHRAIRSLLRALNSLTSDGRFEPAPLFANAV